MVTSMTITALSPRPRRRLILAVAAAVGLALAIEAVLWAAVVPARGYGDVRPAAVVLSDLDSAARSDDWARVDSFIDYDAKARSIVPDLWDSAGAVDRAGFVDFLKPIFRDSWRKAHEARAMQAGSWYEETRTGEARSIIDEVGFDADGEVALRYTFEARGAEQRVVNRRPRLGTLVYDTDLAIRSIRKRIEGQLGHPPDLREFTANLPSWLSRGRTRKFQITPDMFESK